MFHAELKATVPRKILDCAAVSREINFTSKREIRQFRLEQRVFLDGSCIEGEPSSFQAESGVKSTHQAFREARTVGTLGSLNPPQAWRVRCTSAWHVRGTSCWSFHILGI